MWKIKGGSRANHGQNQRAINGLMAKSSTSFKKGNKLGKGGKRKGAGGPTNKEIEKKKAEVEGLQKIHEGMLEALKGQGLKFGKKLKEDLLKHPNLLMAFFKALLDKNEPDARQEFDIQTHGAVIVKTNVNPHAGRKKN